MTWAESRTLLSRKGSVIIRYILAEFIRKVSYISGEPLSRSHISSMTMVGSRILLSRSHVSSMTGGCTCLIYYQGVVSLEKGSVIIRYTLPELIKKVCEAANPALP